MTAYNFMLTAFYIMVGTACIVVAAIVLCGVIGGIYNFIKRNKNGGKHE